jgi:ABC-type nitrate/sulfonate/bicarbonate transport system permease component
MKKTCTLITIAAFLLFWFIITFLDMVNPLILPSPYATFAELLRLFLTGEIVPDVLMTLWRVVLSICVATLIGVPAGLLMGYFDKVYYSLEFLVDFVRSIPSTALIPLFMLVFGIGDLAKVAIVVFSTTFLILINTMYGVKNVKKLRIVAAKTMKATKTQMFTKIIFPESLPYIFAGLRVTVSKALIIIIVVEMMVGIGVGLGKRIMDSQFIYNTPQLYAAILISGIMGYLLNKVFEKIESKSVHWSGN